MAVFLFLLRTESYYTYNCLCLCFRAEKPKDMGHLLVLDLHHPQSLRKLKYSLCIICVSVPRGECVMDRGEGLLFQSSGHQGSLHPLFFFCFFYSGEIKNVSFFPPCSVNQPVIASHPSVNYKSQPYINWCVETFTNGPEELQHQCLTRHFFLI